MDVEFGNAGNTDTQGTGWFVGFSDWAKSGPANLRHIPIDTASSGLCIKWFAHAAGHPAGEAKPISEGRTMSILVGAASEFRIEFCQDTTFAPARTRSHTLRQTGDFVAWGAGLYHRAFGLKDATILTVRFSVPT